MITDEKQASLGEAQPEKGILSAIGQGKAMGQEQGEGGGKTLSECG